MAENKTPKTPTAGGAGAGATPKAKAMSKSAIFQELASRTGLAKKQVAQVFEEVADLLDIQGANPFRVRAYRTAARTIRDLSERLADICADPKKLERLSGIGKDLSIYSFEEYTHVKHVMIELTGEARKGWHYTAFGDPA